MKTLIITFLFLIVNSAYSATPVNEKAEFGQVDARGAFQEADIVSLPLQLEYFPAAIQSQLAKRDGSKVIVDLYFQDGRMKSLNKTGFYPLLDVTRNYGRICAEISTLSPTFVVGHVTLNSVGKSLQGVIEATEAGTYSLSYTSYGAAQGHAMNDFGNGQFDNGNVIQVGATIFHSESKRISVQDLQNLFGPYVIFTYP